MLKNHNVLDLREKNVALDKLLRKKTIKSNITNHNVSNKHNNIIIHMWTEMCVLLVASVVHLSLIINLPSP